MDDVVLESSQEPDSTQTTVSGDLRAAIRDAVQAAVHDTLQGVHKAVQEALPAAIQAELPKTDHNSIPSKVAHHEEKTKYVLSGQPTGWAAMAQVVRDFDQEKMQECRDDIDTLLVFAGLFSAILSAFLVATYPNLQQSSADEVQQLLRQIASQTSSYNIHSNMLNSTYTAAASPPFEPSVSDIRVNTLWFASLILSLVTASFAILVKQWIREYMAVDNPSPQARLRLRHVRNPELRRWKVLEIAAILPLILQTSLGLFFLGLCFLALSVHPSIAFVTLPLVSGWAICFVAVMFMPMFFPRCSYKMTFWKDILSFMRQIPISLVYHSSSVLVNKRLPVLHASSRDRLTKSIVEPLRQARSKMRERASYERDAVLQDTSDVEIMASVDAIQSNDELLVTTIKDSIQQTSLRLYPRLHFVTAVLMSRSRNVDISRSVSEYLLDPHPLISNMDTLTPSVRAMIKDILHPAITAGEGVSGRLLASASAIVYASSSLSPDDTVLEQFDDIGDYLVCWGPGAWGAIASMWSNQACSSSSITDRYVVLFKLLVRSQKPRISTFSCTYMLDCFRAICEMVAPDIRGNRSGLDVLELQHDVWADRFLDLILLDLRRDAPCTGKLSPPHIRHTLIPLIKNQKMTDTAWTELFWYSSHRSAQSFVEVVLTMFDWWSLNHRGVSEGWHGALYQALDKMDPDGKAVCQRNDSSCGHRDVLLTPLIILAALWEGLLNNLLIVINDIVPVMDTLKLQQAIPDDSDPVTELLHLCAFLIRCATLPGSLEDKADWNRLFDAILCQIYAQYQSAIYPTARNIHTGTSHCLDAIQYVEYSYCGCENPWANLVHFSDEDHIRWSEWYSPEKTIFSDSMVERLANLSPHFSKYVERRRERS